jgi:hypothetical protein
MHRSSSSALVFEVPDEKELVKAPDRVTSEIATISLWAVEVRVGSTLGSIMVSADISSHLSRHSL